MIQVGFFEYNIEYLEIDSPSRGRKPLLEYSTNQSFHYLEIDSPSRGRKL